MGERRNAYRILVGKPDGKSPLGRPRRRWVDNIKMDLREVGWDGRDWIDLAQNLLQGLPFSGFRNLVGRYLGGPLGWGTTYRKASTYRIQHRYTSIPRVRFEPKIMVFEWHETVRPRRSATFSAIVNTEF
jgi:hypothetical protein